MKSKTLIWLLLFALASISCVTPAALPASRAYIAPELSAAPIPVWETTVTAGKLNVRHEPGGEVVSYRLEGDTVTVYEKQSGWCRISVGQPELWVYCKWLR